MQRPKDPSKVKGPVVSHVESGVNVDSTVELVTVMIKNWAWWPRNMDQRFEDENIEFQTLEERGQDKCSCVKSTPHKNWFDHKQLNKRNILHQSFGLSRVIKAGIHAPMTCLFSKTLVADKVLRESRCFKQSVLIFTEKYYRRIKSVNVYLAQQSIQERDNSFPVAALCATTKRIE